MAYKSFYESIEEQSRALARIPLVCSFFFSFGFLFPSYLSRFKQDHDDRSVKPPLAVLDHAQILREVMSVYKSSMLGDKMRVKIKRTQAFDKSWISWLPLFRPCVSPTALRRRQSDQNVTIKCLCSIVYVTSRYSFHFRLVFVSAAKKKKKKKRKHWLCHCIVC